MKNNYELPEKQVTEALSKMFMDGGETYTCEDAKRICEETGVDISKFDVLLEKCVKNGWVTDCGNNNYTR